MITLPEAFEQEMKQLLGEEETLKRLKAAM